MPDSEQTDSAGATTPLDGEIGRDRDDRRRQIEAWAEYVRTHSDEEWGRQVNALIESQIAHAQARQFDRPDLAHLRDPAEEDNEIRRPPVARENGEGNEFEEASESDEDDEFNEQ